MFGPGGGGGGGSDSKVPYAAPEETPDIDLWSKKYDD